LNIFFACPPARRLSGERGSRINCLKPEKLRVAVT